MPPRDPRLCPDLQRAMPADSPGHDPGWRDGLNLPWDVLFGDGYFHRVRARAWWHDRHGREVVEVEWSIGGGTFNETYLVDRERMREIG
jgi:hypothetical protein